MTARAWRVGALAGAAGLLVACATAPSLGPGVLAGRLSLQVAADGGQPAQSFTAGFELEGDGRLGELRLFSPLGATLAQARWTPAEATLDTSRGQQRFADLDALAREALGEAVPLAALPDWLAGRPWPGAPALAHDAGFEQLGWQVDLRARAEGRVEARRAAPPALTLRVRLETPAGAGAGR